MNKAPPELTSQQRGIASALHTHAMAVRGLQIFMAGLGAYLGIWDGRGWPAFWIGLAMAALLQTQLPVLPPWLESRRPDK